MKAELNDATIVIAGYCPKTDVAELDTEVIDGCGLIMTSALALPMETDFGAETALVRTSATPDADEADDAGTAGIDTGEFTRRDVVDDPTAGNGRICGTYTIAELENDDAVRINP